MAREANDHFTLWNVGPQQLLVDFHGGRIVTDAGLLAVRALERPLGVIADLARQLPDPRAPQFIRHSVQAILTQEVYALLAGYPDHNDHDDLRHDPLFQILADVSPDTEQPLACGSTLARFQYAFTRRQAERPPEQRHVLLEVRAAQCQRLKVLNGYLVDLFIRTRRSAPAEVILDVDATDDPTHGGQHLAGYHGYFRQHQYFPLHVYEGHTGFPLAVWLRPGTAHASLGAVDILRPIVARLRAAWPGLRILVRADNGLAVPAVYEFCEAEGLDYVLGYATNPVLERATAQALSDLELYYRLYGHRRGEPLQRFEEVKGYQAGSWPHPRRVIAKVEVMPSGSQRRFTVTNLVAPPEVVYREVYVQRGAVPEQPIGEMKNGLRCDRLSSSGFCANALRLLVHALAYAIVVLFREAAGVAEVATASVGTLRQRLWKAGAVVVTSARRVWLHVSESWPYRAVWQRVYQAVQAYVARWPAAVTGPPAVPATPPG